MSSDSDPENDLVVLFVAVFCGAVVTYFLSRYFPKAPYTVIVFLAGIIISAIFGNAATGGDLNKSLKSWEYISPELVLYIFLPALLFGEAMSLNIQHVKGAVLNATLLAGPGAIFGTFATAAMAKWCFSAYSWSWHLCFVFGAILCATDPVAVVALLKKVGASNKLTYLVIGEALMNDGTALVLYNLLYALIATDPDFEVTPRNIALYFLAVIIASPLLGIVFGLATLYVMSIANRRMKEEDTTVQTVVTLLCAYVSFYVAEYQCGISGVITCCTAALVLARYGNPLVLKPDTMKSIWSEIEWIGNTVIFFLAGIIITLRSAEYIGAGEVGYLILTYMGLFIIRGLMVVIMYPFMRHLGQGCTVEDATFLTWGGLRGAVSMCLALSLVQSTENDDTTISADDSHRVLFIVGGVAALTLTLNATTAGSVLRRLGLMKEDHNEEHQIMYHFARKTIRLKAFQLLEEILSEHPDMIDPDFVIRSISFMRQLDDNLTVTTTRTVSSGDAQLQLTSPIANLAPTRGQNQNDETLQTVLRRATENSANDQEKDYHHALSDVLHKIALQKDRGQQGFVIQARQYRTVSLPAVYNPETCHADAESPPPPLNIGNNFPLGDIRMQDIRRAFLNIVRSRYWQQISSGRLPRKSNAAFTLLNSIDVALEHTSWPGLQDWQYIFRSKKQLFKDLLSAFEENMKRSDYIPPGGATAASAALPKAFSTTTALSDSPTTSALPFSSINSTSFNPIQADGDVYTLMPDDRDNGPAASASDQHDITLRDYRCSQAVYLLMSFIEAHQYAQKKMPFYFARGDGQSSTAEEIRVIEESREVVEYARGMLKHIHPSIVRRQLSKLAVRWILHAQEDAVESLLAEGVVTEEQAELLFEELTNDLFAIKQSRWYVIVAYRVYQRIVNRWNRVGNTVFGK
eukprot:gene1852-2026_t